MSTYYLDTSALGKRYVDETGSGWIRALTTPAAGHALLTARISMVEMYSVLARRVREGSVTSQAASIAKQAFAAHSINDYKFIELDMNIVAGARDLLDRHPLRAYDSVQLASALAAHRALAARNFPPLIFISADERLVAIALSEGLTIDNPNLHQ